jgi:exoribonuclease R
MLPTILSDNLCSLQANQPRFAFALDFIFDENLQQIHTDFHMVLIQVTHNFQYGSTPLFQHPAYQSLYDITKRMDKHITDSHDLVSYWMIKMNTVCGNYMADHSIGIFRQATFTKSPQPISTNNSLTTAAKRIINTWNNISGQYVLYHPNIHHDVMDLANYTHITSPIRRLVDLLNQFFMLRSLSLITYSSPDAEEFFQKWMTQLDYINTSMRSIRKIQTDCELLHRCIKTPSLMESTQQGILFDKLQKNDGGFIYMVYLEEFNLLTRLKTYTEYDNFTTHNFQLFLFMDECNLKRKIRVQMVSV